MKMKAKVVRRWRYESPPTPESEKGSLKDIFKKTGKELLKESREEK